MKKALAELWNEYFAEKCAVLDTQEEKTLARKAVEIRQTVNEWLTKEQSEVMEKYMEVVYELQGLSVKKAFFRGCELVTSFFFEIGNFGEK